MEVPVRKRVGASGALALGCLGLVAFAGPAAAQAAPLQATLEPDPVIQFNTVYFASVDECFDVDGSGTPGDVAVTVLRDGVMVGQVPGQVAADGSWKARYLVPFDAAPGRYTTEIVCTPRDGPSPLWRYADLSFTVSPLAKDLRSALTPTTLRPGQNTTYTSIDPCPLPFSQPGANVTFFLSFVGESGTEFPIPVQFPGRKDVQMHADGHWQLDFAVPGPEGVYTVTAACWSHFIPGMLGWIEGLYPSPKFRVDRLAGSTTTVPTTKPPTPTSTNPDGNGGNGGGSQSGEGGPGSGSTPPPAPAVPGQPHFVG